MYLGGGTRLRHLWAPELTKIAQVSQSKWRENHSMATLNNLTIFITGASRGIGRSIALRCARDGANIVIAAKTENPQINAIEVLPQ